MDGGGVRRIFMMSCACVLLAGCAGDAAPSDQAAEKQGGDSHTHSHDVGSATKNFKFTLGKPGDQAAADRTFQIQAVKDFSFSPAALQVDNGETVTFEVTNTDKIAHEFVLGNRAYQELHNNQMEAGGVYHDYSDYSVHVNPGETKGFTWTFERAGLVEFACHVKGHYEQRMIGEIRIS